MSAGLTKTIKALKGKSNLLVTPKIEDFMRRNPEGIIWNQQAYDLIKEITQKWEANSSRGGRFGASGRGKCKRRQIFAYLDMPSPYVTDTDQQNLFEDGKWRHLRWQVKGVQAGALTHVEHPYEYKPLRVSGAMDGLNSYDSFGFELKGDRRMVRSMDGVPDDHNMQIHTMLLATGWDRFVYIIEDKATQNFREIVVKRDKRVINLVRAELEELNEHVEDHRLPPILPACAAKEGPYRSCPFASKCLERHADGDYWPDRAGDWDS